MGQEKMTKLAYKKVAGACTGKKHFTLREWSRSIVCMCITEETSVTTL
jgi:hypothetical protein